MRDDPRDVRVFALGFGDRVDKAALARLTAEKRGRFELVESADAIGARVARLDRRLATPVLTGLTLEAEGATIDAVYPRTLPDLHEEQELTVVGRVRGQGKARLRLRGRGAKPVTVTTTLELAPDPRRPWVGKMWGRARIEHLLEQIALDGAAPDRVAETLDLALAYDVVTPFTAFLAIPASELSAEGAATLGEARARKRAIRAAHPDAALLLGSDGDSAGAASTSEPAPLAPAAMRDAPGESEERLHGGGCAGCRIGAGGGDDQAVTAVGLLMILALRRRSRGRPSADRRGRTALTRLRSPAPLRMKCESSHRS
jgi:hypothetical protein